MPQRGSTGVSTRSIAETRVRVDWWTAQVVRALTTVAVRPILLKGPAVARWLYPDDSGTRPYGDVDLLVAPDQRPVAEETLHRLGFELSPSGCLPAEPSHADVWVRHIDGAVVDLHRTLHGCEHLDPALIWAAATADTGVMNVGGVEIEVPPLALRVLHVVLHALPESGPQAHADLARAVRVVERERWRESAELARRLGVDDEMGYRLALVADELARDLHLPTAAPLRVRPETRALVRLMRRPGLRGKLAYARQKLAPPRSYLTTVGPVRPGRAGLVRAWVRRLISLAWRVPRAMAGVSAARYRRDG